MNDRAELARLRRQDAMRALRLIVLRARPRTEPADTVPEQPEPAAR